MSASLSSIPRSSRIVRYAHGISPDGSRSATFTVYRAAISLGYQSNYSHIDAQWYALDAELPTGKRFRRAWRHTGSRIDRAISDYSAAVAEAIGAGWNVTE